MSEIRRSRKLRRFFTVQPLREPPHDLWLEPSETHHLKDSIRLKPGDNCLITDGEGREGEAFIRAFSKDGRTHVQVLKVTSPKDTGGSEGIRLRLLPAMLRKGKTDLLVEKAQELGVFELWPIASEHCEIKMTQEKSGKMVERWNRIAREASKQSGSLRVVRVAAPRDFKEAAAAVPREEPLVIFHPCPTAVRFPEWIAAIPTLEKKPRVLNIFIGPEGGFSEAEIDWVRWERKDRDLHLVSLGEVLFKADTAFIGIVAALRFSGIA